MTDDGRMTVRDRFERNERAADESEVRIVTLERALWQVRGILLLISLEIPVISAIIASGFRFR